MRHLLCASLTSLVCALCAAGCAPAEEDPINSLGCGFVRDQENCWRVFVRSVEACLGATPTATGVLAEDGKTCTYGGRTITSNNTPINDTALKNISRNFTVTNGARTCLQVIETDSSFEATSEGKKIAYSSNEGAITLVCPSGSKLTGTFDRLYECLTYDGGVPGIATSATETRGNYRLLGMAKPLYDCAKAPKK